MKQEGLDLGRELRDAGMNRTLDHQAIDWLPRYQVQAERFLDRLPHGYRFTGEDLRAYALSHGIEHPNHVNSWSAAASSIIRRWLKFGQVVQGGIGQCTRPESHARIIRAYRKVR